MTLEHDSIDSGRFDPAKLVNTLARGWSAHAGLVDSLVQCWRKLFSTDIQIIEIGANIAYFKCSIDSIRLKGFSDLHCLLLGGQYGDRKKLDEWKRQLAAPGRQVLVLTLDDDSFLKTESIFPAHQGFLILEPDE